MSDDNANARPQGQRRLARWLRFTRHPALCCCCLWLTLEDGRRAKRVFRIIRAFGARRAKGRST